MNALDTPLEGLSTSPPMRAPLLVIVILALTGAILTSLDSRTGLTFALACLYFNFLTIHLESGIYIILAAAVIFVDGWAPTRTPEDVVFRLGLGRVYIMEIAVYGLLLIYVLKRYLGWSPASQRALFSSTPLDRPILAFAALLPLFAFYGLVRGNPLQDAVGYYEWRCLFLAIVFYFLVVTLADTRAKAMHYFSWFIALITTKATYSLLIYLLQIEGPFRNVLGSGPVDEGPENYMFVFAALASISLLLFAREMSNGKRALVCLTVVVTVTNILVSEKRNPQLGLLVGVVVLAWRLPRRQKLRWGAIAGIATAVLLLFSAFLGGRPKAQGLEASASRYTEIIDAVQDPSSLISGSGTFAFHVLDWVDAWNTIVKQPLLGNGFGGQFERNYTLLSFVGGESIEPGIVHNQYLTFWLKMGFIGLAAYVWVFISFFRFSWRVIPGIPRSYGEAVSLGLYAALSGDIFMELWGPDWVGNTKFPIVVFSSLAFAVCLNRNGLPLAVAKGAVHDGKGQP